MKERSICELVQQHSGQTCDCHQQVQGCQVWSFSPHAASFIQIGKLEISKRCQITLIIGLKLRFGAILQPLDCQTGRNGNLEVYLEEPNSDRKW